MAMTDNYNDIIDNMTDDEVCNHLMTYKEKLPLWYQSMVRISQDSLNPRWIKECAREMIQVACCPTFRQYIETKQGMEFQVADIRELVKEMYLFNTLKVLHAFYET